MTEPLPGDAETVPVAFVLRWMARLYLAPPDAAALKLYRAPEGRDLLETLATVPALAPVVTELAALTAPDGNLDAVARRLAAAHAAAFLVGGRRAAAPYASVWLSDSGLMVQEPARAMKQLLAAAGLALPEDIPEPPDHIGFQLNLLAELDERHRAGAETPFAPDTFLRDHILTWLPDFTAAARRLQNPLLYSALAEGTLLYLTGTP